MKEKLSKTIPIRIADTTLESVKGCAQKLDLSEQDTFRLLIKIGLVCLEKTGFDLPKQIAEKALAKK